MKDIDEVTIHAARLNETAVPEEIITGGHLVNVRDGNGYTPVIVGA